MLFDVSKLLLCFIVIRHATVVLSQRRIVGGTNAKPGEFPALVKLYVHTRDGKQLLCGGTLIDLIHVLTAAHCVKRRISVCRLRLYLTANTNNYVYISFLENNGNS